MISIVELQRDVPEFPDAVHTPVTEIGDGTFYAYVRGYDPNTDLLDLRVDLPDDHPTFKAAVADGADPNNVEIVVYVPREDAESASLRTDPGPVVDPRPALRDAALARADEQERAERDARIKKIEDEMRSGKRKRLFPELGRR